MADAAPFPSEEIAAEEAPTAVERLPEPDTDDDFYDDDESSENLPSGRDPEHRPRRPVRDPDEPTTEDQKLTELL